MRQVNFELDGVSGRIGERHDFRNATFAGRLWRWLMRLLGR